MNHLPGYTGHVAGVKTDCGRRTSALAAHNRLRALSTPTPWSCSHLEDLDALKCYEARVEQLYRGLPLPLLRSRLDHTPTPTRLLLATRTPTP